MTTIPSKTGEEVRSLILQMGVGARKDVSPHVDAQIIFDSNLGLREVDNVIISVRNPLRLSVISGVGLEGIRGTRWPWSL